MSDREIVYITDEDIGHLNLQGSDDLHISVSDSSKVLYSMPLENEEG